MMDALDYLGFIEDMEETYQEDYDEWMASMERTHAPKQNILFTMKFVASVRIFIFVARLYRRYYSHISPFQRFVFRSWYLFGVDVYPEDVQEAVNWLKNEYSRFTVSWSNYHKRIA